MRIMQAELSLWLCVAALLTRPQRVDLAVRWTRELGRRLPRAAGASPARAQEAAAWLESISARGAINCLERALALRLYLARRGVAARVVVGMRRDAASWQAHAWLCAPTGEAWMRGDAPLREVFREEQRA